MLKNSTAGSQRTENASRRLTGQYCSVPSNGRYGEKMKNNFGSSTVRHIVDGMAL